MKLLQLTIRNPTQFTELVAIAYTEGEIVKVI